MAGPSDTPGTRDVCIESGEHADERQPESRTPCSFRFIDSEWAPIEQEAVTREVTAAEFVRHAAVSCKPPA